jgi:nicotinamidase-related amidase
MNRITLRRLAVALTAAGTLLVAPSSLSAQELPPAPARAAVTLDASSSALLVLDMTEAPCASQPNCVAIVPRIADLIARARKAGVLVLYSATVPGGLAAPVAQPSFLPGVAPVTGDPIVLGAGQDRFFATPLDEILRRRGIATLILTGWRENGSVLYTAVGATLRNYTVVVPDDATSAAKDYDVAVGRYQLLTQLSANAANEPLKKGAVTLSRTDLITFR